MRRFSFGVLLKITAAAVVFSASFVRPIRAENLPISSTRSPIFSTRAPERLTICSQNLANYGLPEEVAQRVTSKKGFPLEEREKLLVKRFQEAGCQIIAVQEVVGRTAESARAGLNRLAEILSEMSGKQFVPILGGANKGDVRIGFLVATENLIVERVVSYAGALLPPLEKGEQFQRLSRGPLVLQVRWGKQRLTLVAIHLKSKYGGGRDPYRLQFEMLRMQMAEHLRILVEAHFAENLLRDDEWVIILGDRNSRQESASNRILKGEQSLVDFRGNGSCIVSKAGESVCVGGVAEREPRFDSLLSKRFLEGKPSGTYKFGAHFEWIDDILVNRWSLIQALMRGETPRSRVVAEPKGASDHALVATTFFRSRDDG
jgi:endonuclease/exonuclease/phosphatase family metal-dependent hydrolase